MNQLYLIELLFNDLCFLFVNNAVFEELIIILFKHEYTDFDHF